MSVVLWKTLRASALYDSAESVVCRFRLLTQLVFVSVGAVRRERYHSGSGSNTTATSSISVVPSSALPEPCLESTPVILLLEEKYFEQLFTFLETLDKLLAANAKLGMPSGGLNLSLLERERTHHESAEDADHCESSADGPGSAPQPDHCEISVGGPGSAPQPDHRAFLESRVENLCCIIWELLRLLPTNQNLLEGLRYFGHSQEILESKHEGEDLIILWNDLLQPDYPHKLLYSLQIVDLVHSASQNDSGFSDSHMGSDDELSEGDDDAASGTRDLQESWGARFVELGGLKHLYHVLMLGHLEAKKCAPWTQWQQECLAHLLKIICEFGTMKAYGDDDEDDVFGSAEPRVQQPQIQRRDGQFRVRYKSTDKEEVICIRCLSRTMVSTIDMAALMDKLLNISQQATLPVHGGKTRTCGAEGKRPEHGRTRPNMADRRPILVIAVRA